MDTIRETLAKRKLNPADKLIDILEAVEKDEEMMDELLENQAHRGEMMMKSRMLKHKLLKDLVVAKQAEDDQLLKLEQMEREKNASGGAKIPLLYGHQRKQLPDGRWIIDVRKEATETEEA